MENLTTVKNSLGVIDHYLYKGFKILWVPKTFYYRPRYKILYSLNKFDYNLGVYLKGDIIPELEKLIRVGAIPTEVDVEEATPRGSTDRSEIKELRIELEKLKETVENLERLVKRPRNIQKKY